MTPLLHRSKTPLVAGALLLLAVSAALLASASLQSAGAATPITPVGRIGGVTYAKSVYAHGSELASAAKTRAGAPGGNGPLTYHGGPVMKTNKTYAIYWIPSGQTVSANYKTLIDRYFTDVAAASGATSNVYAVETQYSDSSGPITYNSTFGGSTIDTNALPANGCSVSGLSKCLTDTQIISEINNVISSKGWTKNGTTQFFMFTPKNVGSCFYSGARSNSNPCSFTDFCAYHGYTGGLIYANQPYTVNSTYPNSCDVHQYPNGDDSDPTLNVTSHEHREAINDPQLNAWYDADGWEGSDKCAWNFGAVSGSNGSQYNQTINGNHYFLQQEYSNAGNACLLSYGSASPPPPSPPPPPPPPSGTAPTIGSFSPSNGLAGTATVVLTGTNYTGVTSVSIGSIAISSYNVDSTTQITAQIPSNALTGALKVVASGGTVTGSPTFKVVPRFDSFSPAKGKKGSSVTVTGNSLTGTTKVTLNGRSCSFTVLSNTQVRFTVPSFFASSGKIVVTTPGGTATSLTNFVIG